MGVSKLILWPLTFLLTFGEVTLGHPATDLGLCANLSGDIPAGCTENVYAVPTGFQAPGSGRQNPERGFYMHTETLASSWTPVSDEPLSDYVNDGFTLLYRNFILDTFPYADLSDTILQYIRDDFGSIRDAGMKAVVRFCYSIDQDIIDDAPPAQLATHLQQLTPILQENVDVISVVQAGFIGVWGEWYYTANYGNEGNLSPTDWENRRQVVYQLLDALPTSRKIQLRTPDFKRVILDRTTPVTEGEANTDARVARIGHHNDCFLASDDDFGTWLDKPVEYPYVQEETKYVTQGGESCNPNPPRSDCPTALTELSELHYTYLNSGYHPDVLQSWRDQGCYDEIEVSLGYRLVGVVSRIPTQVGVGSTDSVGITVTNMGWSAPTNYRSAQLVIRHSITLEEHESPLESGLDLRNWLPGDHDITLTLVVPSSASTGDYTVYLRLPDGEASLQGIPEYNIVMENLVDSSDPAGRLNLLGTITVV